jgi:hypothetical protein
MKKWIYLAILFAIPKIYAAEGKSHFHLVDMKCTAEDSDELETTPQSPPLDVDDPGTPGCNRWEINVLVDGDITKHEKDWQLPLLDMNFGIGNNLQLKYEVPYINSDTDGTSQTAVGSSKFGVKEKFYEDEASELEIAFYPQVEFATPNSKAVKKGLESSGSITTLPLLVSKKIGEMENGNVMLSANISYNISAQDDTKNFATAAVGIGMPFYRRIAFMGELSTEQSMRKDKEDTREQLLKVNAGFLGAVNQQFLLYASVGESLYASDKEDHTYLVAGIRLLTK